MRRVLLILALAGAAGAAAATAATGTVSAKLKPVVTSSHGSGTFSGRRVAAKRSVVTVRWRLSLTGLSKPPTKAVLVFASPRFSITLCRPCGLHAAGSLALMPALWKKVVAGTASVRVATKAHPAGELGGRLLPAK